MSVKWITVPRALMDQTESVLRARGAQRIPLEQDHANTSCSTGRFNLCAQGFSLESNEIRLVRIEGSSVAIFNCLIIPGRPDLTPVFVTEFLVIGGMPRLLFVDLQTPGLNESACRKVAVDCDVESQRWSKWQYAEPPPKWAIEFSSRHAVYAKPTENYEEFPVTDIYTNYLNIWFDMAQSAGDVIPESSRIAIQHFKQHHVEQSPVVSYLTRVFGEAWTVRFIGNFLYR